MTEEKLAILERFGDSDMQDAIAEVRKLREALSDIVNASRDDGLPAMCNWMRNRAFTALTNEDTLCICGHALENHHRSWLWGGHELIEECEEFGSNETGGMIYLDGKWSDHCYVFRRRGGEHGSRKSSEAEDGSEAG